MDIKQLAGAIAATDGFLQFSKIPSGAVAALTSVSGSAFAVVAAGFARARAGLHVLVMDDRDKAAYLCNDLYRLCDPGRVLFFPTTNKRSILFSGQDPSGVIQRTAALEAIRNYDNHGPLLICTYPEALAEKVVGRDELRRSVVSVAVGEKPGMDFLAQTLAEYGFERVDFVYEPGQYAMRGGIFDLFSFSENMPYRLDFFGDEVESIRRFDIASQLSQERVQRIEILPNMSSGPTGAAAALSRVSLAEFAGPAIWWLEDPDHALKKLNEIRTKLLADLDEPSTIDTLVTSRKAFLHDTAEATLCLLKDNLRERAADQTVDFGCAPQPAFNKKFDLLAADLRVRAEEGYTTLILSDNRAQFERLESIFNSIGAADVKFEPVSLTLHEGFVDRQAKLCVYTDHQIFDRYHRYRIKGELSRSESLTVEELNKLKPGDYVVHIDHGVGRFGGLVRTMENGKTQEALKIEYRDGDVLLVNVHALHRIVRYREAGAEPPRIYKLGSGAWQKMKQATKKAVKEIARELVLLYAKRKSSPGFAFSHDTYLQNEMEASFEYEETPDQQKAIEAVKSDMEKPYPMDRLVCGDVGFGKTEVAIRAAFKAAADGKQTAVLVPTTLLSLQHFRTFSSRLKGFPVRVEQLSRARTAADTKAILADLKSGKIDILVGTHKILGKEIAFKDLGLLIIDEEQKFGVGSKEKLRQLSASVDTLTMTATPIPRTLQFSLMGSRDLSVISTPPPNRQPIATESHTFDEGIVKEAIELELSRSGQVFYLHNRVHDIDKVDKMIRRVCPGIRTIIGHGQMNAGELEKVVMDFIYGDADVLIATTIIENGIDIPNANTIIIDNAHMFGLSDLHQLRGRVGRSDKKAWCYLFTPPDEMLTSDARRRLRALEEFSDLGSGFNIAMQDLDIRGAGNLLGAEQSGFIADIGFETYQRILDEAMEELRTEGIAAPGQQEETVPSLFAADCQIETTTEALIPDFYVQQSAEKLRLYKELDSITDPDAMQNFADTLKDRFGELPPAVKELMDIVLLRRACMEAGFEKAKVKNGLLLLSFVENQQSVFYKGGYFVTMLRHITENPAKFLFRQNNNKLGLTVRNIGNAAEALQVVHQLGEYSRTNTPAK